MAFNLDISRGSSNWPAWVRFEGQGRRKSSPLHEEMIVIHTKSENEIEKTSRRQRPTVGEKHPELKTVNK